MPSASLGQGAGIGCHGGPTVTPYESQESHGASPPWVVETWHCQLPPGVSSDTSSEPGMPVPAAEECLLQRRQG